MRDHLDVECINLKLSLMCDFLSISLPRNLGSVHHRSHSSSTEIRTSDCSHGAQRLLTFIDHISSTPILHQRSIFLKKIQAYMKMKWNDLMRKETPWKESENGMLRVLRWDSGNRRTLRKFSRNIYSVHHRYHSSGTENRTPDHSHGCLMHYSTELSRADLFVYWEHRNWILDLN